MTYRPIHLALAAALSACAAGPRATSAPAVPGPTRSRVASSHALPPLDGHNLRTTAVEVTYEPGGSTPAHSHPCPVMVYVIEGSIRTRVHGEPEAIYRAGQTFFESANGIHELSANASQRERARFLAIFVCDRDTPLTTPDRKPADPGEQHAARARDALVGRPAPAGALHLLDDRSVELRDLVGQKPIYLKFWATWCVPCRKQMPHLEAAHRKYGDRIAIVAVDLGLNDSIEAVRAFRSAHGMTVPIAIDDGTLAERFHVAVTPQHILVDRAGVIRHVGFGATAELDRALDSLARGGAAPIDPKPPAGQPDAPLSLTLRDGSTFTIAAHAGRPIALSFVTTSCDWYLAKSRPAMSEACIAHARQVESLRQTAPRVEWVTIAHPVWASNDKLDEYRKRLAVNTPIGIDDTATWFRRFHVREVPTTILLDERGHEVARVGGRGDDLARALARFR